MGEWADYWDDADLYADPHDQRVTLNGAVIDNADADSMAEAEDAWCFIACPHTPSHRRPNPNDQPPAAAP